MTLIDMLVGVDESYRSDTETFGSISEHLVKMQVSLPGI